jgi:hypothetical protein
MNQPHRNPVAHSAEIKPFQFPYRQIPFKIFSLPDITPAQALFLSLFGYGGNRKKTNTQLCLMFDPSRKPYEETARVFISKLKAKGWLIIKGQGKARTIDIHPDLKQYFHRGSPYIRIDGDILHTPVSHTKKIVWAFKRKLPDASNQYIARILGLNPWEIWYHTQSLNPLGPQMQPPGSSTLYIDSISNIRFILENKSNIYESTSKEVDKELRRRSSSAADSYFSPTEDSNMPTPSPKPFDYSTLQSRSATPKKPIKINPDLLAELQSITLTHITKHQEGKKACAASCRVIGGLKRGLYTILDDGAVKCITKDLARYGVTPEQVTELLHKKWSPEERQMLYQNLNNHYSEAYGYFGKIKKIDLATALFHPVQLFSPLLTAYFRPRVLREKQAPTSVKPPVELENASKAILDACNEKSPTFRFIEMLHDIRKHFDEEVIVRQKSIGINTYSWFTWYTEMVRFIAGEFNGMPKWPFFKPGSVPFTEWEKYYKSKIRREVENNLWCREMKKSENSSKIQEYQRYLEGEGIFVSYEKAVEMYNS